MPGVMMLSRGIRRVPLNYEHPKREKFEYRNGVLAYVETWQPVFDAFYVPAVREWLAGWERWQTSPGSDCTFEEWEGPGPDPDFHYPGEAWPADVEMGVCMYESVTEGTPISAVYPDTPEGHRAMAEQIAREDTSITSAMTVADWLEVIEGQAGAPFGTVVGTGEPFRSGPTPSKDVTEPEEGR